MLLSRFNYRDGGGDGGGRVEKRKKENALINYERN